MVFISPNHKGHLFLRGTLEGVVGWLWPITGERQKHEKVRQSDLELGRSDARHGFPVLEGKLEQWWKKHPDVNHEWVEILIASGSGILIKWRLKNICHLERIDGATPMYWFMMPPCKSLLFGSGCSHLLSPLCKWILFHPIYTPTKQEPLDHCSVRAGEGFKRLTCLGAKDMGKIKEKNLPPKNGCNIHTLPETNSSHLKIDGWFRWIFFWKDLIGRALTLRGA